MVSLRALLAERGLTSLDGLRRSLGTPQRELARIAQVSGIHRTFENIKGVAGPLGFPSNGVQFDQDGGAMRRYRGGFIEMARLSAGASAFKTTTFNVTFRGFKCVYESDVDQSSPHDEPYFVVAVVTTGASGTTLLGGSAGYEGVDSGTVRSESTLIASGMIPMISAINAFAYEHDSGSPEAVKESVASQAVEAAANAAKSLVSEIPADWTFGSDLGGIVMVVAQALTFTLLDLDDDQIGQAGKGLFEQSGEPPPIEGNFEGNDYNVKLTISGGDEGKYILYFFVQLIETSPQPVPT